MIEVDASAVSKRKERREARRRNTKLNNASTPKHIQASARYSCGGISNHNNKASKLPDASPKSRISVLNFVLIVKIDCIKFPTHIGWL
jgi:hypothetical protein